MYPAVPRDVDSLRLPAGWYETAPVLSESNTVCTFEVNVRLTRDDLRKAFASVSTNPKKFSKLNFVFCNVYFNVLPNRIVTCTAASSLETAKNIIQRFCLRLLAVNIYVTYRNLRSKNDVCKAHGPRAIDLLALHEAYPLHTTFPDSYPALCFRFVGQSTTINVYATGAVVVTGAPRYDIARHYWTWMYHTILPYFSLATSGTHANSSRIRRQSIREHSTVEQRVAQIRARTVPAPTVAVGPTDVTRRAHRFPDHAAGCVLISGTEPEVRAHWEFVSEALEFGAPQRVCAAHVASRCLTADEARRLPAVEYAEHVLDGVRAIVHDYVTAQI